MNTSSTPTLLHIDASPRSARSRSRQLGQDFVTAWQRERPAGQVVDRDVGHEPPPFITEAWVEGAFTAPAEQSVAAREAIAVSNRYVDEVLAADEIVITTPLYNFSLPAALKAWLDQVIRAGRTFAIKDGQYNGLAKGKRTTVLVTSGGDYRPETPGAAYNFLEPYLRAVLGFIGITEVRFVYAHSQNLGGEAGVQALADAQATVAKLAVAA